MGVDFFYLTILAILFLLLFAIAEVLYHLFKMEPEITRKIVHVVTGFITLLFPILLHSHWSVLMLCSSFLLILVASMKYKFLPSINNIDRTSRGSISYPISVYGCFYAYSVFNNYVFFYLPVLTLAISDPMAALVGRKFPKGKYVFHKEQKTLMGSGAFFVSAFFIALFLLKIYLDHGNSNVFVTAFVIAMLTCIVEAITQRGYDNLTVPFGALAVLLIRELS